LNPGVGRAIIKTRSDPLLRRPEKTAGEKGNIATMWKKPKIVEIAVGMEINSYACAELA
jgi:coenzyme PQQ precursor peptide PqqA